MSTRRTALIAVLIGILGGVAFALTRSRPDVAPPAPASTPVAGEEETPAIAESTTPRPLTAKEWETALGGEPELVSEEVPPPRTAVTTAMPIAEKLAREPLSTVPHELVGAWDEAPDSEHPGTHRAFVAVVDPGIPPRELEQLVWDIRERHRGAEVLDIRVFDSAAAAANSSGVDGAASRARHLVADVKRNDRLGFDQTTVLGQIIER